MTAIVPLSVKDTIISRTLSVLGSPILPQEAAISDTDDFIPALYRYYSYIPIQTTRAYTFGTERELTVTEASVLPDSNHFCVGVIGFAPRNQLGQTRFDEYLLGLQYGTPIFNPEQQVLSATILDQNVGDIYFEQDPVAQTYTFVVGGACVLGVIFGLGHYDPEIIPYRHIDLLSALLGETYYARLYAARISGQFDTADFKLSADFLANRMAYNNDRIKDMITAMGLTPMLRG